MNILLVYATNSGTTMMAAQTVSDTLTAAGHQVSMKQAMEINADTIAAAPMVIFGSPSWDFDGNEGMPHEDYIPLFEKLKVLNMNNKPFAVFGLGDSSYTHFCGAVDHFEELVKTMGGKLVAPSIRIDKYFSDQQKHTEELTKWAQTVGSSIS